jgi:hypothetical protein
MTADENMLDIAEFASKSHYSERHIRQLCRDHTIEGATKLTGRSRKWLIPASALQKLRQRKPDNDVILQDSNSKLPLELVNADQEKHWQDVESHLAAIEQPFSDIDLSGWPFYRDFSCDEKTTEEMQSHFRDTVFWQNVNNYNEKANKANSIQKDLVEEIMQEALKIAPFEDIWLEQEQCITQYFVSSVIDISLGRIIRFIRRYRWDELAQGLTCQGFFISMGINSEKKHRELIETYSQDERVKSLRDMIAELSSLRSEILTKLKSAINDKEYKYSFCSKCPLVKSGHIQL